MSSLILLGWAGRFITSYNERMSEEDALLEEAMDNLRESIQRLRATQARMHSTGLDKHRDYSDLLHRVASALAMSEAAFMEARRKAERKGKH